MYAKVLLIMYLLHISIDPYHLIILRIFFFDKPCSLIIFYCTKSSEDLFFILNFIKLFSWRIWVVIPSFIFLKFNPETHKHVLVILFNILSWLNFVNEPFFLHLYIHTPLNFIYDFLFTLLDHIFDYIFVRLEFIFFCFFFGILWFILIPWFRSFIVSFIYIQQFILLTSEIKCLMLWHSAHRFNLSWWHLIRIQSVLESCILLLFPKKKLWRYCFLLMFINFFLFLQSFKCILILCLHIVVL